MEILYSPSRGNCVNFREIRKLKHERVSNVEPSIPKNTGTHQDPKSIFHVEKCGKCPKPPGLAFVHESTIEQRIVVVTRERHL